MIFVKHICPRCGEKPRIAGEFYAVCPNGHLKGSKSRDQQSALAEWDKRIKEWYDTHGIKEPTFSDYLNGRVKAQTEGV
jgi:hypothetical protein